MKPRLLAYALAVALSAGFATAKEMTFEQAKASVSSAHRDLTALNAGDLQISCRLAALLWEEGYVIKPDDLPKWKALLERPDQNYYARLCAAYFLLDTDSAARVFLEQELNSTDLRHRYNAAQVLLLVSNDDPTPEVKTWHLNLMIRHLDDGSLDQVPIQNFEEKSSEAYPDGDLNDINASPVDEFCHRFGLLRATEAVPAILSYLQRPPKKNPLIFDTLGDIGDPQAIPYLLRQLTNDDACAYALGKLECREAVPALISKLSKNDDPSIHYFQGPDDIILQALRDIGDSSAVPAIRDYLQGARAAENLATARRVFIELNSTDPAKDLIAQYDREPEELQRGEIISDLATFFPGPLTVTKLASIGGTSDSAFLRQRALYGLGQVGKKAALTKLAQLLALPFPAELNTQWGFQRIPHDFTSYFHAYIAEQLRAATYQDFGQNSAQWQTWIAKWMPN